MVYGAQEALFIFSSVYLVYVVCVSSIIKYVYELKYVNSELKKFEVDICIDI